MAINTKSYSMAQQRYIEILNAKQSESEQPITKQVAALESGHHKLAMLLKHILATLMLEGNQHLFDQMPEDWHLMVKAWHEQYQQRIAMMGAFVQVDEGG